MISEINQAIDDLSNLKSISQLEKETAKATETAQELEDRAKVQEQRLEEAKLRFEKIEQEDRERCKKTAELLREFEKNSCNGPFFQSLLEILINYQGNELRTLFFL